jgi:hypothetical protein
MTVNMLIQIDKLVQLIESPVFTCTFLRPLFRCGWLANGWVLCEPLRPSSPAAGAGEIPTPIQVPLRTSDAAAAVVGICSPKEQTQQC